MIDQQKKEIEANNDIDPAEKEKLLHMLNEAGSKKIKDPKTGKQATQPANLISKQGKVAGVSGKIFTDAEIRNQLDEMIKKLVISDIA